MIPINTQYAIHTLLSEISLTEYLMENNQIPTLIAQNRMRRSAASKKQCLPSQIL